MLFVQREETKLLLIHRADRGDPWSNQMAFPGGHVEATDDGAVQAAYRETFEEVGIRREGITHLADLGLFRTQTVKIDLRVFVGLWDGRALLRPCPEEVTRAVEVSLSALMAEHERQGFSGQTSEALGDHLVYPLTAPPIWGVTARIIHHLLSLIGRGSGPQTRR